MGAKSGNSMRLQPINSAGDATADGLSREHVKFRRTIGDLHEVCKIEQVRVLSRTATHLLTRIDRWVWCGFACAGGSYQPPLERWRGRAAYVRPPRCAMPLVLVRQETRRLQR
jgi:hypothetical protein